MGDIKKFWNSCKEVFDEEVPGILGNFFPALGGIAGMIVVVKKVGDNYRRVCSKEEIPNFMDCAAYTCKQGYVLTNMDRDKIVGLLTQNYATDTEREALEIVEEFIDGYMGGNITEENVDEYSVGDNYLSFNFFSDYGDEYEYNEQYIETVMNAFNVLLGKNIFDCYAIGGHIDSWEE